MHIFTLLSLLLKTSRPGTHSHMSSLILCAYPVDRRWCPALYLKEYLNHTKRLRQPDQRVAQCSGVSRDTLPRWIWAGLQLSGLDTSPHKPHSTREATTSLADSRHDPFDTILKSSSTFARYYKRPMKAVAETTFSHSSLKSSKSH